MSRIAVLFHQSELNSKAYIVDELARFWRDAGHEVIYLFGTRHYVPADLIIVHVDLSVVPAEYQAFAAKYPIVLNGSLADIRKSRVSQLLIKRDDAWSGPVIVKSDLNCAGVSEKRIGRSWLEQRSQLARRIRGAIERRLPRSSVPSANYQILTCLADVPPRWFRRSDIVIEKFLPEIEDNLYHLRIFQVLGDRWTCARLSSDQPIVKARNSLRVTDIEPHAVVEHWRRTFRLEYGKLDYVVVDGKAILLDVNKTPAASRGYRDSEELVTRRRWLAEGVNAFLA